jgi:hypothetical protein
MSEVLDPNAEAARQKIRVAIGVPAGDDVKTGFAFDLARMVGATIANRPDIEVRLFALKGTILPKSRHELVLAAQECDATHLLFLDADMRFPKRLLADLLAHGEPVVAVNYVTRRMPCQPVTFANDESATDRVFTTPEQTGLEAVASTGFGAMLIDLDVFRLMPQPWFMVGWHPAGNYIGEDVYFCGKVRSLGVNILIDHTLSQQIAHIGEFEFRHEHALAYQEVMSEAASGGDN